MPAAPFHRGKHSSRGQRARKAGWMPSSEGRALSSGVMGFMLGAACASLLMLARPNSAQDRPNNPAGKMPAARAAAKHGSAMQAVKKSVSRVVQAANSGPTIEPTTASAKSGRRPLSFYTGGVRSTLFSAPQPPAPPKPKPIKIKPKPIAKPIVVPPAPINPFADWVYSGTVKIGETTMALLENSKTKEGQYLKVGDSFMGAQVSALTPEMITLNQGGQEHRLNKSDTVTVTPLDKSAPFLGGAGGGQPGQPGQPQPGQPGQSSPPPMIQMNGAPMMLNNIEGLRSGAIRTFIRKGRR